MDTFKRFAKYNTICKYIANIILDRKYSAIALVCPFDILEICR
jgi:hypothetical protein